ncbi:MAG: hypothetical protein HQM12_24290 [SAR324 cluster bacterium]|nr:hypothetical protein [SAR324 cluster bacterium]
MSKEIIRLDYEELVKAYWQNLNLLLRSFNTGGEFLEMWVADENPEKSIVNLIEAAQAGQCEQLDLFISETIWNKLHFENIHEMLNGVCDVTVHQESGGVLMSVRGLQDWAMFQDVHAIYRKRIRDAYQQKSLEGKLEPVPGQILLTSQTSGVSLSVLVDAESHVIQQALYIGSQSPTQKGVLNKLCQWLVGTPVQEASEHALIYLEYSLRDPQQKHHVQGIISPRNADPVFHLPLALTREILPTYRGKTGYQIQQNFFIRKPSDQWTQLSDQEKFAKAESVLSALCPGLSLQPVDVELISVQDTKITVHFVKELLSLEKAILLTQIERGMKDGIDGQLRLYMEELKDKNIIRREI